MSAVGYDLKFAAEAIWKVGLASLLLGAGLPVLYAAGIRSLAWGRGGSASGAEQRPGNVRSIAASRPNPLGTVLAAVIFLIVAYAIVAGIVYIVATGKGSNYDITFKHVIPEIYKKGS